METLGIPETDKKRLGNGIGNVSNIRETFWGRIGGVSVPTAFPNGYGSPTGVFVLQSFHASRGTVNS
ncbi:hypothetical protein Tco_0805776, partial [Tanacetum coccineum]